MYYVVGMGVGGVGRPAAPDLRQVHGPQREGRRPRHGGVRQAEPEAALAARELQQLIIRVIARAQLFSPSLVIRQVDPLYRSVQLIISGALQFGSYPFVTILKGTSPFLTMIYILIYGQFLIHFLLLMNFSALNALRLSNIKLMSPRL